MDESITPSTIAAQRERFEQSRLAATWPTPSRVQAFTTLRGPAGVSDPPFDSLNLGTRCGDDAAAVARNRDALALHFGLPSAPRWLRQVHGTNVAIDPDHDEPEADAAVTRVPGTVLAVLSADCLPVVFAAEDGSEVAAAHAGWRGLSAGVLEATVAAMRTPPEKILAWLGPAAGAQAYEVGEEVYAAFVARDADAEHAFIATRPGHRLVNLHALARQRLDTVGVTRVIGGGFCTISDPQRFFSHRRDKVSGRMATLIWIEPEASCLI